MKSSKKVALGTLMACLILGNVASAQVYGRDDASDKTWEKIDLKDFKGILDAEHAVGVEGKALNLSGDISTDKKFAVVAYNKGIANINGEFINISSAGTLGEAVGIAAITSGYGDSSGKLLQFTDGGTVNLGEAGITKDITINAKGKSATGIYCMRNINDPDKNNGIIAEPSFVNIKGNNLIINATANDDNGYAVGIWAQNNTGEKGNESTVTIDAQNTVINAVSANKEADNSGEYKSIGIVAYSGSKVNINNNLTINAGTAISTRGGSATIINENGTGTVKINGDINFNYDEPTSGTKVDATVKINLTNEDSYMNGNIFVNGNPFPQGEKATVSAMNMGISNGAQWTTTDNSFVNNLKVDGGIINVEGTGNKLDVGNLTGQQGTFNVSDINNKIEVANRSYETAVTVAGTSDITDKIAAGEYSLDDVAKTITIGEGSRAMTVASAEGTVAGEMTAKTDASGNIIQDTIKETVNTTNAGIADMASLALVAWRAENNDMNKRLGELRNSNGERGIWTRMVRGESEYNSVKNQYNTYQLGYDEKLSTDKSWTVGAAISYTEGDSSYSKGTGENKHKGFSIYGSKLNEDGSFIDLIAKYARLDHEYTVAGGIGNSEYEANGYSVSAEYGKRFTKANGFWIEPQVELTYGTVGSASYKAQNGIVEQDSMDSLVGRIGFSLGKNIKQGNVYARASYLYDFDGETNIRFTDRNNVSRSMEQDLGGGWFEVGVGTNINLSKATYLYADAERTFGGEVDTPWQYNVGIRYSF